VMTVIALRSVLFQRHNYYASLEDFSDL